MMPLPRLIRQLALCLAVVLTAPEARASTYPLLDQALALEAQGQPEAALIALDRLVSAQPQNAAYRLALARSLLRKGETARAQFHLRQARASPHLNASDRAALARVLNRLEGGRRHEAWLRFSLAPESNPGQRTSAQSIEIDGLDWRLNEAARAKAAMGLGFGIGGALTPPIKEGLRFRLGASLEGQVFEDRLLNDIFLRAEAGLQGLTPAGLSWRGLVTATWRHAAGELQGRALGAKGEITQPLGRASQLRLRAEIDRWRHPRTPLQDGTRSTVSAMLIHIWRPDLLLRGGVFIHRTKARADWESLRAAGLSFGLQRAFENGFILSADLSLSAMRRDGPAPLFAKQRRERRSSLSLRALHREMTLKGFAPMLEMGFDRQRSTVTLHDYRNLRFSVGFTREF